MDWRKTSVWLLASSLIICFWCSVSSIVVGGMLGYEVGYRTASVTYLPETGVLVTRLDRLGPAAQTDIGRGDTIVALNGVRIEDVPMLHNELSQYQPGEQVQITYRQRLNERVTSVVLGHHPGSEQEFPYLGIYYTARAEAPADI